MQVRDCHHDNPIAFQAIDQPIRETGQQASSQPRVNLRTGHGVSGHPPDRPIQFVEELLPQAINLFIVPDNSIIDFLLG
jgi:hypothetical protein